mmetsp:Transcript_11807/g.17703  ORF Transcript_11807/g.17703 Transcript_11807/m.17703 type:complete len:97 (+) Transcript_11807:520-810(+)
MVACMGKGSFQKDVFLMLSARQVRGQLQRLHSALALQNRIFAIFAPFILKALLTNDASKRWDDLFEVKVAIETSATPTIREGTIVASPVTRRFSSW